MFWKTKQRSITPLEEIVLTKMNLFLKSLVIIFINRKEERKNFTIERHITDVISKNKIWKIKSDGLEIIIRKSEGFKIKDIELSSNDWIIHFNYFDVVDAQIQFDLLCERVDQLFTLYAKYKDAGLMETFYDLADRTDKIESGKRNKRVEL